MKKLLRLVITCMVVFMLATVVGCNAQLGPDTAANVVDKAIKAKQATDDALFIKSQITLIREQMKALKGLDRDQSQWPPDKLKVYTELQATIDNLVDFRITMDSVNRTEVPPDPVQLE
jgi:hypothetical protein